jgi:hypothetical protein
MKIEMSERTVLRKNYRSAGSAVLGIYVNDDGSFELQVASGGMLCGIYIGDREALRELAILCEHVAAHEPSRIGAKS